MATIKHQDYILEAIDQLRRRKARPNINRISNYLFRHFGISSKETNSALEKLVDAEIVIKVDYKGCASYRNAAKWSMLSSYKSRQEHDFDLTTYVCRTVAELILVESTYLDHGVPYDILEKHIFRKDRRFTKQYFNYILERELESGSLIKMENGNYFVGDHTPNYPDSADVSETAAVTSSAETPAPAKLDTAELPSVPLPKKSAKTSKKRKLDEDSSSDTGTPNIYKSNINHSFSKSVSLSKVDSARNSSKAESARNSPRVDSMKSSPKVDSVGKLVQSYKTKPTRKSESVSNSDPKDSLDADDGGNSKENSSDSKDNSSVNLEPDPNVNGRRKRSKKIVFDPSDNNLPRPKRRNRGRPLLPKASPPGNKTFSPNKQLRKNSCDSIEKVKKVEQSNTSSIFQPVCGICDTSEKRIKGVLDSFISCTDCITKVHLKCFENTKAAGSMPKVDVNNWQCSNCKTCSVCEDATEMEKLITCFACDEAFHPECHDTISNNQTKNWKDNDRWFCSNCFAENSVTEDEEEKKQLNISSLLKPTVVKTESATNTPSLISSRGDTDSEIPDLKESIIIENIFKDPLEGYPVDESIPDASKWSSEDVYKYFVKYFQPSVAEIFKKQEIDGLSLLLMKRYDILSNFNLKLGPALKIYGHVKRLQIRRTAPHLLWS